MEAGTIDYISLLREWQTLVAGVLALAGALITTFILIRQHSFDKRKHREERQRTGFYMRSLIPDALSDLISYSKECFQYVDDRGALPDKPNEAIAIIKENIKYSDSKTSENLYKIVSFYQMHNSRIDLYQQNTSSNKKDNMLYDIAMLCHYSNRLFSYARNKVESVEEISPSETEMADAAKSMIGIDRYLNNTKTYNAILEQIEAERKLQDALKQNACKACNLIIKLQTYYKQKLKIIKSNT